MSVHSAPPNVCMRGFFPKKAFHGGGVQIYLGKKFMGKLF